MKKSIGNVWIGILLMITLPAAGRERLRPFDPGKDLISLHYDHAPDKDDGQSAAADRTMLETLFGRKWIPSHVVAVSGTYGINAAEFNPGSDGVMDTVWGTNGGWVSAHRDWNEALEKVGKRWINVLKNGGEVYVKEGGQSDFTADLIRMIRDRFPEIDTRMRVHVIQHSQWNEDKTTPSALAYTKKNTDYIRIPDANQYLNKEGGDSLFVKAALTHPVFGSIWRAAFDYYPPEQRLDFSDTGELMVILGTGALGIDEFRSRFLDRKNEK